MMRTLIDCMAAMPQAGDSVFSAFITLVENAKKRPAINADPARHARFSKSSIRTI